LEFSKLIYSEIGIVLLFEAYMFSIIKLDKSRHHFCTFIVIYFPPNDNKNFMKKTILLIILLFSFSISNQLFSQSPSINAVYTAQKCDELVHRLSDSLMQITGDVSNNYLKINEMTNRVTHQFVTEFEKELGKPVTGDDFKFLWQQSTKCINEPSTAAGFNLCSSCLGSGYRMCDYCHGRASEPCKICNATGIIFYNGNKIGCIECQSTGYRNCLKCNGKGDLKCNSCYGMGHMK
jgi:hypothetical protein